MSFVQYQLHGHFVTKPVKMHCGGRPGANGDSVIGQYSSTRFFIDVTSAEELKTGCAGAPKSVEVQHVGVS